MGWGRQWRLIGLQNPEKPPKLARLAERAEKWTILGYYLVMTTKI
jgi:hypothetical protein